jgi:hypothetical protein
VVFSSTLMRSNKPFQIGNLLERSEISRLLSRARALGELDALVHGLIPSPLNAHCRVLAVRDDTLVVAADSPVWAARLRYQSSLLVKQLSGVSSVKLRTVQVRVRAPEQSPDGRITPIRQPVSGRNSVALKQAARSVTDAGLKAALLRLAGRRTLPGRQRPEDDGNG